MLFRSDRWIADGRLLLAKQKFVRESVDEAVRDQPSGIGVIGERMDIGAQMIDEILLSEFEVVDRVMQQVAPTKSRTGQEH